MNNLPTIALVVNPAKDTSSMSDIPTEVPSSGGSKPKGESRSQVPSSEAEHQTPNSPAEAPPVALLPVMPGKNLKSWPKHEEGGAIRYLPTEEALTIRYTTDAHTAAYCAPEVLRRLSKGAPERLLARGSRGVSVGYLSLDIDGAGHKADLAWHAAEHEKVRRLKHELPGGFFYQTRNGYRLMWRLAAPCIIQNELDAARWKRFYRRFLLMLSRRFGIVGDPTCVDWTRLFRLPHATRPKADGTPGDAPEELAMEGDPTFASPLHFEPTPGDLEADLAEARRLDAEALASKKIEEAGSTTAKNGRRSLSSPWGTTVRALEKVLLAEVETNTCQEPKPRPEEKGTPHPKPVQLKNYGRAWATVISVNETLTLKKTPKGGRNDALNKAAFKLGQVAHLLPKNCSIVASLLDACKKNGLIDDEGHEAVLATIRRSMKEGEAQPMTPPARNKPTARNKPLLITHPQEGVTTKPTIRLTPDLAGITTAAIRALVERPELFARGGELVELVLVPDPDDKQGLGTPTLRLLPRPTLKEKLGESARFLRRAASGGWVETAPTDAIVQGVEARGQWPGLRPILGTANALFPREDGTVCDQEGYDQQSWFYLVLRGTCEPIPEAPTREDACQALARLTSLFCDFPFANEASRFVPVAALLSLLLVPALKGANIPAFLVDSNTPGAGKGLLLDVVCIIVMGRIPPKSAWRNNEEMEKVLGAMALEGAPVLVLDNISQQLPFGGSAIELVLTCSGQYTPRILGRSEISKRPWRTIIFGTGNNITVAGDTRRRVLICSLQTPLENPENRADFTYPDLRLEAARRRPELVRDALILLRAYSVAGRPNPAKALGSFEEWSRIVPSAIVWAGGANVLAAVPRSETNEDPALSALRVLLQAWPRLDPKGQGLRLADLVKLLYPSVTEGSSPINDDLSPVREAVESLAPCKPPGVVHFDPRRLGYVLRAHQGRNLGGRMFLTGNSVHGSKTWLVADPHNRQPIVQAQAPLSEDA